jgi:MFS family permease
MGTFRGLGATYVGSVSRIVEVVAPARLGEPFRRLLASSWISNLGDGIALAAGPLLVASQTDNPLLVAMAGVATMVPQLLFGLLAGALADRWDRKRIVVFGNIARVAVLALLIATITADQVNIAVVLVTMFLLGVAETFVDATAGTLLPMLVPKKDLGTANSRFMAGFLTTNQLVGPPIGAFLFAAGLAVPFVGQAVTVALAALIVWNISFPAVERPAEQQHIVKDIRDGVVWLWRHHAVRTLALTIVTFNVTWGAAWSVLVLYAKERLDMDEVGFGLLTTAGALGGMLSTACFGWLERRIKLATIMRVCLTLEMLTHIAFAVTTRAWVALAIMFVFGAYAFVWGTVSGTVRQRAVPTEFQGRVGSVYMLGVIGGIVIGRFIGGVIADQWGVTAPFWFAFFGTAIILALIWRELGHIAHADEEAQAADRQAGDAVTASPA